MIQRIMIEDEQDSVRGRGLTRSMLVWISRKAVPSPSASWIPSGVGSVDLALRFSSSTPSCASSPFTCRLTAPWVTNSSSAASVMLRWRTVASKAFSAVSDGRDWLTLLSSFGWSTVS